MSRSDADRRHDAFCSTWSIAAGARDYVPAPADADDDADADEGVGR